MRLTLEQLSDNVGIQIRFMWVGARRCEGCPADIWYLKEELLTYSLGGPRDIKVKDSTGYTVGYLILEEYDHKWYFDSVDDVPAVRTNKGLPKCWKCKCPTEERRDFADMSIREFCPRCKI